MEIRVLKYFLMVAREESITKAASRLHITQPTLSRQMADLEADMGVPLLDRSGRKIALTPEGILLRRRAEEIVSLVDKTEMEVSQAAENLEGTISVAGGDLSQARDFVRLIKEFQTRHPWYISAITRTSRLTFVNVWIMAASMWASLLSLSIGRSMSHSPSENRAGWGCICVRMIRSPRSRKYGCKTLKAALCCRGFVQILMRCSLPDIRIRIAILP